MDSRITKEMDEITQALDNIDDYVIFGGFCSHLATGLETSADIDIYVKNKELLNKIKDQFKNKNWKIDFQSNNKNSEHNYVRLSKNNTTFDVHTSLLGTKIFLKQTKKIKYKKIYLNCLNTEALYITKLQTIIDTNRTSEKVLRDKQVIEVIKKDIDYIVLRKILLKLPKEFWTKGRF
ncbi:MAG: hypothetical protein PHH82_00825 [Candidatus ainarchaeum sp.]|nr:hypothetical protein [Candidatus ainarchaeum sp.]